MMLPFLNAEELKACQSEAKQDMLLQRPIERIIPGFRSTPPLSAIVDRFRPLGSGHSRIHRTSARSPTSCVLDPVPPFFWPLWHL